MELTCISLTVLTLLQLCRAEISDALPENWYSANVINDGFQPKPLSEIFSTETPFSPTNPIVVLPKSSQMPDGLSPPSPDATPRDFTKTSYFPSTFTTSLPSTYQSSPDYSQPSRQVEITQYTEQTPPPSAAYVPNLETTLGLQNPTLYTAPPSLQTTLAQTQPQFFKNQYSPDVSTILQQIQTSTLPPSIQTQAPTQAQFKLKNQYPSDIPTILQQIQTSTIAPYNYKQTSRAANVAKSLDSYTVPTPATVIIQPTSNIPSSSRSIPSTTPLPTELRASSTSLPGELHKSSTPQHPSLPIAAPFPIRIRVLSPSGSITNVNFNPVISTTTKKPTTTRKPTTKRPRTPKPKRNTYEACLDGCKGKRESICAVPLSTTHIDPETLKGFPSVCHMACFNSYSKKEHYEKILDGRCGRLRTRIRTVDSTKLKREELNKAQYVIDNGSKTIVEVQALH